MLRRTPPGTPTPEITSNIQSTISLNNSSPMKHCNSESDIPNTSRKRKHGDDFADMFKTFSEKLTLQLREWKTEVSQEITEIKAGLNGVREDINLLNKTSNEMKTELNSIRKEYNEIKKDVKNINLKQKKMEDDFITLQSSMQFHSDRHEEINQKIDLLSLETKKVGTIESEILELKKQNRKLKLEMNTNDQRGRLQNIEIIGVPECVNENLIDIVLNITKIIGAPISPNEIVHVNRITPLNKPQGRPRIIIAKLTTRLAKDNIISKARKMQLTTRNLHISGETKPIYVNDNLTRHNRQLFKMCKDMAKSKGFKYVWTKNGKIFARQSDTTSLVHIADEEDIKLKIT